MPEQSTAVEQVVEARRPPARSRAVPLVLLLLILAAVPNLLLFRGVDNRVDHNFAAVHRNETADLTELAYTECKNCRDRYGMHLALYVVAPGSRVVLPRTGPYGASRHLTNQVTERLYALARVSTVEWVDEAPALTVDPRPYILASGPGGERGAPWALAVRSPTGVVGGTANPDGFLAQALRDGRHHHPDGLPRDLVLLAWPEPRGDYAYQDLLIERSLLRQERGS
jgi:hypothetical protein